MSLNQTKQTATQARKLAMIASPLGEGQEKDYSRIRVSNVLNAPKLVP